MPGTDGLAATRRLLSPSVTRRLISSLASQAVAAPGLSSAARTANGTDLARLTEREVMALVAQGLTTKTHVSRIMTKLAARDRAQLVVIAYESGLVVPGSPA